MQWNHLLCLNDMSVEKVLGSVTLEEITVQGMIRIAKVLTQTRSLLKLSSCLYGKIFGKDHPVTYFKRFLFDFVTFLWYSITRLGGVLT